MLLPIGRLLRLSLLPSALADILVGVVIGAGGRWPAGYDAPALVLASLGIYHGALAINDWADRKTDAQTRPDRPIPSGAVGPQVALSLGLSLILLGIGSALLVGPWAAAWMGALACLALAYDLVGRGPLLGPALLGLCRFGNLGAGLMLTTWLQVPLSEDQLNHPRPQVQVLAPAILYGLYVFTVSVLGRLEDGEDTRPLERRPSRLLGLAAAILAAVPLLGLVMGPELTALSDGQAVTDRGHGEVSPPGYALSIAISMGAAWGLLRSARRKGPWTQGAVGAAMGMALRRLLAFTAACAALLVQTGPAPGVVALIALLGYPASYALRRVFPPS